MPDFAVPEIAIAVEADGWPAETVLDSLCRRALGALDVDWAEGAELSFLFADDARVAGLNTEYRDKAGPTNVLSFETGDPLLPGDIVLALETVTREAGAQGKSFEDHLVHLLMHGALHLAGYDHVDDGEAESMEGVERASLARLGIADPYGESTDAQR